jgi:hypothetical protein
MKLGTLRRFATVLVLVGAVAVSTAGCLVVPVPVGGHGNHRNHGHSQRW